jgi:hypothetical protein
MKPETAKQTTPHDYRSSVFQNAVIPQKDVKLRAKSDCALYRDGDLYGRWAGVQERGIEDADERVLLVLVDIADFGYPLGLA